MLLVRRQRRPASASCAGLQSRLRTPALPEVVKQWSLTSLREKLIKIGAKVVCHGRYVIFQMAEVAVPKELFREILRLIDGLRPRPAATRGADASSRRKDRPARAAIAPH